MVVKDAGGWLPGPLLNSQLVLYTELESVDRSSADPGLGSFEKLEFIGERKDKKILSDFNKICYYFIQRFGYIRISE